MRKTGRILCATATAVFCALGTTAEELPKPEPATIEAEKISFDRPANVAIAEGNVLIRYKDAVLRADRVRFNTESKDVWAEGNVRLNRAGQEWVAPSVYYNLETQALDAQELRGFFPPLVVRGEHIRQVRTNHYAFSRATLTTCEYERPHFRLEATRGEIWPGERVVLYNATLRFGEVPVFWFPMIVWSLKADTAPLAITVGQSSRWGFFLLGTVSFQLNENAELAVHADTRTRRGFAPGADLQYRLGDAGQGLLRGYYINDAEPKDELDRESGKKVPINRYRAGWQHKQTALAGREQLSLTVDLEKLSDPDVLDDFFSREFRRNREPDSVADITWRGEHFTLSALARPQLNGFFAEVERLPELKLAVARVRLGGLPVFYEGESSVGQFHNVRGSEPVVGTNAAAVFVGSAVRADTFHQLVAPFRMFGWLSVLPRAGVRGTYYSRAPEQPVGVEPAWRAVYNLGVESSFKASRTWGQVRHIVQPFANYSWVPRPARTPEELFQFDTVRFATLRDGSTVLVTRYSPLDFPALNTMDAIDRENTVRFGLRQKWQTRRAPDLVELSAWTDWRAERERDESEFGDLFAALEVRPRDWLLLDGFARHDLDRGLVRELNTAVRVFQADRWSVGVGSRFLREDSNLLSGSVAVRLARRWTLQMYQSVDMHDGVWEEQQYVLRQETHDWLIDYGVRHRSQRKRDDELAVFFAVTLKAYPGLRFSANRVDLGEDS